MKIWSFLEQNGSSRKLGGFCSTKHAGAVLGVDAIYLREGLDTVRWIILPCWARYFFNVFSSTKRTFPQTLVVKVLQNPKLIILGTKICCAAMVPDKLDLPSRCSISSPRCDLLMVLARTSVDSQRATWVQTGQRSG